LLVRIRGAHRGLLLTGLLAVIASFDITTA
jgi:uncharacterized membrane protein (DUF4010 family)